MERKVVLVDGPYAGKILHLRDDEMVDYFRVVIPDKEAVRLLIHPPIPRWEIAPVLETLTYRISRSPCGNWIGEIE